MQETVVRFTQFRNNLTSVLKGFLEGNKNSAIAILYQPKGSGQDPQIAGYLLSPDAYEAYSRAPIQLLSMGDFDSPAQLFKSEHYPPEWDGKVPSKIRLIDTVRETISPQLAIDSMLLPNNSFFDCWVNSHGLVYAWLGFENDRRKVQLKNHEFEVVEWINDDNS